MTSPHGTSSVLAQPHPTLTGGMGVYNNWRFGSVRHFGESSKGEWTLLVYDKNIDDVVKSGYYWQLTFYGTKFSLPYVKAVEAQSGDELIYHAEWVKEEDGQLEFVEDVEPQNPTDDQPLYIKIVTSEAMQWLSLNLFDQDFSSNSTDPARKIQKADKTGTVWELTIDPADFPQDDNGELSEVSTLTLTGQDSGDLYLLPFADRYPKTLPTHPSDADWPDHPNAGDTVHQIGKILSEPFTWSITMPTPGDCDYDLDHGGIICTFDDGAGFTLTDVSLQALRDAGVPESIIDSLQSLQGQRFATEQAFVEAVQAQLGTEHTAQYLSLILEHAETARGHVILYPKDFEAIKATVQYVVIGSGGQNSNTWDGTYQVPTKGSGDLAFDVTWEPQEAWFSFRAPSPDTRSMWCEDVPDGRPGVDTEGNTPSTDDDKGPPNRGTDTATLAWRITAEPHPDPATESCQIRVTWETADGQTIDDAGEVRLEVQPQRLCEAFQEPSETLEATATYPWKVVDRHEYVACHITDQEQEERENVMENGTRKYWPISDHEKVLEPGQCRSWYKKELMFRFLPETWPSQPPQDIPLPTSPEEGNIAIHYDCQWVEDEIANPFLLVYTTHWTWTYRCPTVYVEGEGRQTPLGGGWECDETLTHVTWECDAICDYAELPGEFVPPVPVLEHVLTLHP